MTIAPKEPKKTHVLILSTALRLFVERGYFATSIHDIRRSANISIGSIYHHFDSKKSIARAIYDDLFSRMTTVIEEVAAPHKTTEGKCRAIIATLFALSETDPLTMHFVLNARHREFLPDALPICSTRPFEMMKDIIIDGIAFGEVRQLDPVVASAVVFGGAIRLIHLALDGVLPRPITTYLEETVEAGWRGIAT